MWLWNMSDIIRMKMHQTSKLVRIQKILREQLVLTFKLFTGTLLGPFGSLFLARFESAILWQALKRDLLFSDIHKDDDDVDDLDDDDLNRGLSR